MKQTKYTFQDCKIQLWNQSGMIVSHPMLFYCLPVSVVLSVQEWYIFVLYLLTSTLAEML